MAGETHRHAGVLSTHGLLLLLLQTKVLTELLLTTLSLPSCHLIVIEHARVFHEAGRQARSPFWLSLRLLSVLIKERRKVVFLVLTR
jgi:hypothetical protein